MRRYWKWIIGLVAILLVGLLVWFLINFYYYSTKRLPPWEKERIEQVYHDEWLGVSTPPVIWYDENGGVEEEGVWRYLGTYGDCVIILRMLDNYIHNSMSEVPLPVCILDDPWPVHYHHECDILVFNKRETAKYGRRLIRIYEFEYYEAESWLSDQHYRQIANDIEEISSNNLTQDKKEKIERLYADAPFEKSVLPGQPQIVWYDENGRVEEEGVWRYVCSETMYFHVFLRIGDNKDEFNNELDQPYVIQGLTRPVYYPVEAEVILFKENGMYTYSQVCGIEKEGEISVWPLSEIQNINEWLYYENALEAITRKIEKIAAAHN